MPEEPGRRWYSDLLRDAHITQGEAAWLLGITRYDILDLMARYSIPSGPQTARRCNKTSRKPGDSRERQQLLTAVSNSSPLILYARIGRLELLKALFGEILIPPAVWHEVVTGGTGRNGEREVRQSDWIRQRSLPTMSSS